VRIDIYADWIEQASEWQQFLEFWRLYQSGQFVDIVAIPSDWHDQSPHAPADWQVGTLLPIRDALFTITEIFEFASRLALTEAGDDPMHIEFTLAGLAGRELFNADRQRIPFFPRGYITQMPEFKCTLDIPRSELVASSKDLAVTQSLDLFSHFGWDTNREILQRWQDQLKP
jgi:hypothetical protein